MNISVCGLVGCAFGLSLATVARGGPGTTSPVAQPAVTVWAAGDGVRVNPETGRYFEDRPEIHKDYPTGDYRAKNGVWDGAARRIRLQAARNEFAAFQVIVESAVPLAGISVRLDALAGPNGARIAPPHVALLQAWYVHVTKPSSGYQKTSLGPGWYPDALIPAAAGKSLAFDIPDARNGIGPTQRNQTVWVDVFVPRDRAAAPPGDYRGELLVSWPGGEQRIAVELAVWDFALPDEIHCRGDIWNSTIKQMSPEEELAYYQLAHQHRFHPGVEGYRPGLKIDGQKVTLDWDTYDRRLGRYFDGAAFTKAQGYWGPGEGTPVPRIILPFNCNRPGRTGGWPIPMPQDQPTPEFEAVWLDTARQVRAHFDEHPVWRTVGKVAFLGGLDESYTDTAYAKMIYYSKLLRRGLGDGAAGPRVSTSVPSAAGGPTSGPAPVMWFQFRIDGGYNWAAMEKLHSYVDLWVCHTAGFDYGKVVHFRDLGVEPWFYGPMVYERPGNASCGSNTFTDLDLLTGRGVGWVAWRLRSGYCQWEFDAFYDSSRATSRPTKPFEPAWTNPMNCRVGTNEYNGSGLLIYRGALAGTPAPIASIRLKAHRRGFQDYEYFWLLREAGHGDEADRLVNSIVLTDPFGRANWQNTDIWRNNPEAWDAARLEAGARIAALNAAHSH